MSLQPSRRTRWPPPTWPCAWRLLSSTSTLWRERTPPQGTGPVSCARAVTMHTPRCSARGSLRALARLSTCFFVVLVPESSKTEFDLLLSQPTFLPCASPILPTQPWPCGLLDNLVLTRFWETFAFLLCHGKGFPWPFVSALGNVVIMLSTHKESWGFTDLKNSPGFCINRAILAWLLQ